MQRPLAAREPAPATTNTKGGSQEDSETVDHNIDMLLLAWREVIIARRRKEAAESSITSEPERDKEKKPCPNALHS